MQRPEPPRACIWLTGLSGSGKSTTAIALAQRLEALGHQVRVFDGDTVRASLASPLGFSRKDRDEQVARVARLAREAINHGEIVICALISPYRAGRDRARATVGPAAFIEVFVDTPLEVCEARDLKGLYRRARSGAITHFTGVDDPYEEPVSPDLRLTTIRRTPEENIADLIDLLRQRGALASRAAALGESALSSDADQGAEV
jgi:adenylyl-sulfate kinase